MTPDDVLDVLQAHGLIDTSGDWSLETAAGGLNSRVFQVRRAGERPALTVRLARPEQSFAHEIQALGEAAGCPGVPRPLLAIDGLLVHEYLPGAPAPLAGVSDASLTALAATLVCLHRARHDRFTRWPDASMVAGTFRDLFMLRLATLRSYEAYDAALAGEVDPRLPALIEAVSSLALDDPVWSRAAFARLHGDLSIGNMLWSEEGVGLIDWEYTRVGDPAEELAYVLTEQAVPDAIAAELRRCYEEAGGAVDAWLRVPAYCLYTAVDSALWWADYIAMHDPPQGRRALEARIEMAAHWLAGGIPR